MAYHNVVDITIMFLVIQHKVLAFSCTKFSNGYKLICQDEKGIKRKNIWTLILPMGEINELAS